MKKFFIQIAALFLVIIVTTMVAFNSKINLNVGGGGGGSSISQVKINDTMIPVSVADTPELRVMGLGGRDSLASDSGMLFVFDKSDKYSFWMKGMKFPLDFIWIQNGLVVDLLSNIAPPGPNQTDSEIPIYQPVVPIDRLLEVNAGFISAHNIKIGDSVEYK